MNRSELVTELNHLERNIQREGVYGGMATSEAIDKLNAFLIANNFDIVKEMKSMFQDLAILKLQLNDKTETIKHLTRP